MFNFACQPIDPAWPCSCVSVSTKRCTHSSRAQDTFLRSDNHLTLNSSTLKNLAESLKFMGHFGTKNIPSPFNLFLHCNCSFDNFILQF